MRPFGGFALPTSAALTVQSLMAALPAEIVESAANFAKPASRRLPDAIPNPV